MKNRYSVLCDGINVDYFIGDKCPDDLCGDHCHDRYEITYLISSSGRYIVEGSEHKFTRGTLILLNPTSYHNVSVETESKIEAYTIHFSKAVLPDKVVTLLDRLSDVAEGRGIFFSQRCISEPLINCFERFSVCDRLNDEERQAFIPLVLAEIIILLHAAEGERMRAAEGELGARVAKYLSSNIHRNLSLEALARRFFVSKYYLCRAFKSYHGISLHAYINQKRIVYARQLIESGMTASDAAERVGFGDYSAFYRAYIRIVGHSPTSEQ